MAEAMTAAEYPQHSGTGVLFLLLAIIAALLFAIILAQMDDLPLTQHAQTSHAGQSWNAASIQAYMHKCTPNEYLCPNGIVVRWCMLPPVEGKPPLAVGLFIGSEIRQIISGFASRPEYWQNRNCK